MQIVLDEGYIGHIGGSSFDGAGNLYTLVTEAPGAGNTMARVMRRAPDGTWTEVHRFTEGVDGKPGFGSVAAAPNGDLICSLSLRSAEGVQRYACEVLTKAAIPWAFGQGSGALPAVQPETPTDLYAGQYKSDAEVYGPPGLFVRLNKQLAALQQIRRLLKQAGWLK